jgi:hypothetical protein
MVETCFVIEPIGAKCRRFGSVPTTFSMLSSSGLALLGPWPIRSAASSPKRSCNVASSGAATRRSSAGFSAEVFATSTREIFAGLGFTLAGGVYG